jgi:glycolate oxidase subunit GlcD
MLSSMPTSTLTQFLTLAEKMLGKQAILNSLPQRFPYERDANFMLATLPACVVLPSTTAQVQWIVKTCNQLGLSYTARGAGTGLSGGSLAVSEAGVIISFAKMNKLLEINPKEGCAKVQAGLVNAKLNTALAPHGLFYAPDPSSQSACTFGGNWAENAGGIHCAKYGVTTDHTLSLCWVTPQAEIVWSNAPKTTFAPNGLNIRQLLIGSEGTLGLLCEAWVKVLPKPTHVAVALMAFGSLESASQAVSAIIQAGINPAALELIDALTVQCVNKAFGVGLPETAQAVLLAELDAFHPEELAYLLTALQSTIESFTPLSVETATSPERIAQLWKARKGAVASYGNISPAFYVMDPVIPRSKLAETLTEINAIAKKYDLVIANVFHAGDGNLHPHLMFEPTDVEQMERVKQASHEIMHLCVKVGGTLSGEHGIGLEKQGYLHDELSSASIGWMRAVQEAIAPEGLCNANKILPLKGFCSEGGHSHATPAGNSSGGRPLSPSGLASADLWI